MSSTISSGPSPAAGPALAPSTLLATTLGAFQVTLSVLLVALTGLVWSLVRRSLRTKLGAEVIGNGKTPGHACPPELLKDDFSTLKSGNGVVNGFAFDREISVPFDVGDVRVSKILVHPIKVGPIYAGGVS